MANLNKTKRRIRSVNYTKKITSAMELVSTIKLKRYKNVMLSYQNYIEEISSFVFNVLKGINDQNSIEKYIVNKNADKDLVIVISSNLGLCASFNNDIVKFVSNNINKDDTELLLIGNKANKPLEQLGYSLNKDYINLNENINYSDLRNLSNKLLFEFLKEKYKSIKVVYTKFVNSIRFNPSVITLLPFDINKVSLTSNQYPPIYDSDPKTLIEEIMPLYVSSILYQKVVESEVSQQASRRNAMEAATDNADELIDKLTIEYNKARQASITQEITEVISSTLK